MVEEGRHRRQRDRRCDPDTRSAEFDGEARRPADECGAGERRRQPDGGLGEPGGAAGQGGQPVIEERLVGQRVAVEARQEPVAGDDLLDDARLARLVVPDDVRVAEAVERGGEKAGGEEQRQPVSGRQTGPARRAAPSSGPRRP